MSVQTVISQTSRYPSWHNLGLRTRGQIRFSLTDENTLGRNNFLLHLIKTASDLQKVPIDTARETASYIFKILQPTPLPDCLADRLIKAVEKTGIFEPSTIAIFQKSLATEPIEFHEALALGFEKNVLDIYLKANFLTRSDYLDDNPKQQIFAICCRHISVYDSRDRETLYRLMVTLLEQDSRLVRTDPTTKKSPLEDLIDGQGNITYLMSLIPLDVREVEVCGHLDAYGTGYYAELDHGELIYMMSVPSFLHNMIERCLNSKIKEEGQTTFCFLYDARMMAFARYVNEWMLKLPANDKHTKEDKANFENIVAALHEFTSDQRIAFGDALDVKINKTILERYKIRHWEEIQNRLSPLFVQCSTFFNAPNAGPPASAIHRYYVEDLEKAAKDDKLSPNKRLLALNRLTKTARFKALDPQERIAYFTEICNAASKQINSIQNLVTSLRGEIGLSDVVQEDTVKELLKITPTLFALIEKTQEQGRNHLPTAYSTDKTITHNIHEALNARERWEALYQAIQAHFNTEVARIGQMNIDFDDLLDFVFKTNECPVDPKEIIKLFTSLKLITLADLERAMSP